MSRTLLNGSEQIQAATIPWSAMASGAIVPIASIINGGEIILSTGAVAMGASLAMGGYSITGLGTPVNGTDAATKIYVDDKVSGVGGIFFTQTVSVSNVTTLSGLPTVDGYTMTAGQIVLLQAQSTGSQNGPWIVGAGAWTRPAWWASGSTANPGSYFYVDNYGTTYHDTKWWLTTVGTITVDTTAIAFSQDLSGIVYTAGSGLTLTGGAFSVNTGNGITLSSGNLTAVGTGIISVGASGIGVTASSSNGQVIVGNASNVPTWTTLSGDLTLNATGTMTLATVNSSVGTYGAASTVPLVTVNAKGLVTSVTGATVVAPAGTLTGTALAAGVVSSSLTSVGTITSGTWTGSAVGIGYGGTGQSTALAGFNALSPMTTAGDLIYGGTSGSASRLAVGTSSQVLTGGTTPTWGSVSLATMISGFGAGVAAALGNAVNAAGGAVLYSGALGTPTQGVLTNATGLPIGGLTGLGTGIATMLGTAVTGSGGSVLATGATISGATMSGTTTISNAPVLSALTGYVYANAGSAATASATLPSTALSMSVNETPTGSLNGTNTTFTLAHSPANNSLMFLLNGQLLRPGGSYDYTVSGATVTMNFAPASVDYVSANYFY